MHAKTTWVVIADAGHAHIVAAMGPGKGLSEVTAFDAAELHKHSRDLGADRPGRTSDRFGPGRHAMEPRHTPEDVAKAAFENAIADYLIESAKKSRYDRLALVAPPKALGALRDMLDGHVTVDATLDKDLTHVAIHDLEPHLRDLVNF